MQKRYIDVDEFALMLSIHCEMIAHNDYDSQVAKGYRLAYRHVIELLTNPACNNYLLVDVPDEPDETTQSDTKQNVSEQGVSEQADTKQDVSEQDVSEQGRTDLDDDFIITKASPACMGIYTKDATGDTKQNETEHKDTAASETGHGVSAQCDGDSCYINYD